MLPDHLQHSLRPNTGKLGGRAELLDWKNRTKLSVHSTTAFRKSAPTVPSTPMLLFWLAYQILVDAGAIDTIRRPPPNFL